MKKKINFFVATIAMFITITNAGHARTTKGTEFWIGFMENLTLSFNGPPQFTLNITSDVATSGVLTVPYTGYSQTFTVAPSQVTQVTLPQGIYYPQGDETVANNGIKITANDPIEVTAFHYRVYFTESSIALPITELGTDYLVIAQKDTNSFSPSEFIVVATEDSTTIEIIPSVVTVSTRPAGVPFTKLLMKGQVYQVQAYGDLTGTSVRSVSPVKKIAVFGGARQAYVGCSLNADSHVYDQLYPFSNWGTSYSLIPFYTHSGDYFKIVASQNGTIVSLASGANYNLNKGQFVDVFLNATDIVIANNPIAVAQISTSQDCNPSLFAKGDPNMIVLVPNNLLKKKTTFYTPTYITLSTLAVTFPQHFINILVPNSGVPLITLDGISISSSFAPLPNSSSFSYATIILDTLGLLTHTLQCDSGFNAFTYGFWDYNSYSHHFGFHQDTSTGLNEFFPENNITLFPNPTSDLLQIKSSIAIQSVTIYDCLGNQCVIKSNIGSKTPLVNLTNLASGLYLCKITFQNTTIPVVFRKFHKTF